MDSAATNTTAEYAANCNRASAGLSPDTILAMVAPADSGSGFWCEPGRRSQDSIVGVVDDRTGGRRAMLQAAAKILRGYGVRCRMTGDLLSVYGPKRGER